MSEQPKEKKPGFLSSIKTALDHGKALATAIVLLVTLGTSLYASFKPEAEKKAETTYGALKQPIEDAVNKTMAHDRELSLLTRKLAEVEARLDAYENRSVVRPDRPRLVRTAPLVATNDEDMLDGDGLADEPAMSATFQLPERPWEQKE